MGVTQPSAPIAEGFFIEAGSAFHEAYNYNYRKKKRRASCPVGYATLILNGCKSLRLAFAIGLLAGKQLIPDSQKPLHPISHSTARCRPRYTETG